MSQLRDSIRTAVEQANKAYEEAGKSLEQINALFQAIPVEDVLHSQDVRDIREMAVQGKDTASQVLHDLEVLEVLEESVQALESVRGE